MDGNSRMRDFRRNQDSLLDKTKQTTETAPKPPQRQQSKRTEMATPHDLTE